MATERDQARRIEVATVWKKRHNKGKQAPIEQLKEESASVVSKASAKANKKRKKKKKQSRKEKNSSHQPSDQTHNAAPAETALQGDPRTRSKTHASQTWLLCITHPFSHAAADTDADRHGHEKGVADGVDGGLGNGIGGYG